MQKKKSVLISFFALVLAACLALGLFLSLPKKAEAAPMSSNTVSIGKNNTLTDLVKTDGGIDKYVLQDLFAKLTGDEKKATLDEVKIQANKDKNEPNGNGMFNGMTALQIAELNKDTATNKNRDLIVQFGGLKWTVVYLSLDRNGDPVATLWLVDNTDLNTKTAKYCSYTTSQYQTNIAYPSLYVTSPLRSALNLGTKVSGSTSGSISQPAQNKDDKLAPFTMLDTEIAGSTKNSYSLVKYLDMPYLIEYQERESLISIQGSTALNSPSSAYGIPLEHYSTHDWTENDRGYGIKSKDNSNFNLDYNSYTLNNYIASKTSGSTITTGNNSYLASRNNMDLSQVSELTSDGIQWKKTSEWTDSELTTVRGWTDAESWAFDPIWLPSFEEALVTSGNTIWRVSANQRCFNQGYSARSGSNTSACKLYQCQADGVVPSTGSATTAYAVRPALHLNLAAVAEAAGHLPYDKPTTTTQTVTYNGAEQSFVLPEIKDAVYAPATLGAEWFDSANRTIKAKNVGTYTVTATLPADGEWKADGSKTPLEMKLIIQPAKFTIDFTKGSTFDFSQSNDYVYRSTGDKIKLKFPEEVETWDNVINVPNKTDDDEIELRYCIDKHDEDITDHKKYLDDVENTLLPQKKAQDDSLWLEYDESVAELNVDAPGGYCVFYRIKSANYETEYGYFSVHIATETLTIKVKSYELHAPYIYGDKQIPGTLDELKELAEALITEAVDNNGDNRLKGNSPLDKTKFDFYLIDESDTIHYMSGDPEYKQEKRLNVGTYELGVRYVDGANSKYIKCEWENNPPKLEIKPKFVELVWTGNSAFDSDKVSSTSTVSAKDDGFDWVYDGTEHAPTAEFTEPFDGGVTIKVRVKGGETTVGEYSATAELFNLDSGTDIKNYTFDPDGSDDGQTSNKTQEFRILKSTNWWDQRYEADLQGMNKPLQIDKMPLPHFGEPKQVKIQYYKYSGTGDPDLSEGNKVDAANVTKEGGYYYVVITSDGTKNYDGLNSGDDTGHEDNYIIKVSECAHNDCTEWVVYDGDPNKHTRTCHDCGEVFIRDHVAKKKAGTEDIDWQTSETEHWAICADCGEKIQSGAHSQETVPGEAPTCEKSGWTDGQRCPTCNKTLVERQVREQLPHHFTTEEITIAATCSVPGQKKGYCDRCEKEVTEEIPATGVHDMEYHAKVAATETTNGCEGYWQCKECNNLYKDSVGNDKTTLSELIIPALGITPPEGGSPSGGSGDGGNTGDGSGGSSGDGGGSTGDGGSTGGSSGGDEGSVNPPLGGDTGLSSGSDDINEFFKKNWWWMALIFAMIVLLILLFALLGAIRHRREKRENDEKFERLLRMQMMQTYGGMGGFAAPADDGTPAVEGQPAPAQLPFNQEMFNAAISAAVSSAMAATMQAIKSGDLPVDGGSSDSSARENVDVDGFYDDVEEDK